MSENKDLEIIKENINKAYEIACLMKEIARLMKDITRLKAELAKRPEVVRCVECKKWTPPETIASRDPLDPPYVEPPECSKFKTVTCENDYCSAGVRRESEGK